MPATVMSIKYACHLLTSVKPTDLQWSGMVPSCHQQGTGAVPKSSRPKTATLYHSLGSALLPAVDLYSPEAATSSCRCDPAVFCGRVA